MGAMGCCYEVLCYDVEGIVARGLLVQDDECVVYMVCRCVGGGVGWHGYHGVCLSLFCDAA